MRISKLLVMFAFFQLNVYDTEFVSLDSSSVSERNLMNVLVCAVMNNFLCGEKWRHPQLMHLFHRQGTDRSFLC